MNGARIGVLATVLASGSLPVVGCTSMKAQVRARAARDFACSEAETRIVDAVEGVYRLEGCGFEASYECRENATLDVTCQQLYMNKLSDRQEPKSRAGQGQAKTSP